MSTVKMAISKRRSLGIFIFFSFYICPSLTICTNYTWIGLPTAGAMYGTAANVQDLGTCQSTCYSNSGCYGVSWNSATSNCQLNLNSSTAISYNSIQQQTYYSLIRTLSNCDSAGNCTYSWNGTADVHGSGATLTSITNVNECIASCQQSTCGALDWNSDNKQCWTYSSAPGTTYPNAKIYFFQKTCTGPPPTPPSTTAPGTSPSISASTSVGSSQSGRPTPTLSSQSSSSSSGAAAPSSSAPSSSSTPSSSSAPSSSVPPISPTAPTGSAASSSSRAVVGSTPGMSASNEVVGYPMAIKPAYIVLAGLGGGCLLLVLTAIIILCEYPLHGAETYSKNGTLVNTNGAATYTQEINMEAAGSSDNVEFNPYYNKSEIDAPDFTKEENIM